LHTTRDAMNKQRYFLRIVFHLKNIIHGVKD